MCTASRARSCKHAAVMTSEWAQTSISLIDRNGAVEETVDMPGESLESQLAAAEAWLSLRTDEGANREAGVRLFCSWTPAEGKRAMTLPATLVRALADAHGTFWLDAYSTEKDDQPGA